MLVDKNNDPECHMMLIWENLNNAQAAVFGVCLKALGSTKSVPVGRERDIAV